MRILLKALIVAGSVTQLASLSAHAVESCRDTVPKLQREVPELKAYLGRQSAPPVPCSSLDLRAAQVDVKCVTSKGATFVRVSRKNFGEAWKGPDGLIWSDYVQNDTQDSAVDTCMSHGGHLPSKADFERGEANGFREVLPNMRGRWFWSSSVYPISDDHAYNFSGDNGTFDFDRRFYGLNHAVRCVGR